jgi:catechol-2,3-dioxygenase
VSARLGRLHLNVTDLGRATRFYTQVLGLRISARSGGLVFLSSGAPHHELALHELPTAAGDPPITRGVGTVGFEVPDRLELAAVCDRLLRSGARVTAMDQGISVSLHTADPDGNRLEVYCDTRHEASGRRVWTGEARTVTAAEIATPGLQAIADR